MATNDHSLSIMLRKSLFHRYDHQQTLLFRCLSLTPEFKSRFYFPLERLDQLLDGTYPKEQSWVGKWRAYLEQFNKLRIDQIKDMLHVCAKRSAMPQDILRHLRTDHWTGKLAEATGREMAIVLYSIAVLTQSRAIDLYKLRTEPFFRNILKQALQRKDLTKFTSVALSQSLYAFALLELKAHDLLPLYSAQIAHPKRQTKLTTQTIANVLWSWAKLSYSNSTHLEALSSTAVAKRREANEQELTNVLWAWAMLGYTSDENWRLLLQEISTRAAYLTGQGFALIFSSCAKSGFYDEQGSMALLKYMAECKRLVLFDTRVLTTIIWSLGKIQFRWNDPSLHAIVTESVKESRLAAASNQELSSLAIGLTHMKWQDIDNCSKLHAEIIKKDRLTNYDHLTLCNLIWAIGKQPRRDLNVQRSLAIELSDRRSKLDQFSAQSLVGVVVGWAHCSFPDGPESNIVLREIMKKSRLKEYNPQEYANLCWAFGRLGIHSWKIHSRLAEQILQDDILKQLTPQALANILLGWAHGRFTDPGGVDTVVRRLLRNDLPRLKSQEIASVAWALGKLEYTTEVPVRVIALEISRHERLSEYTPLQMSIILLGWSKSEMHTFHLWDRVLAEFSSRQETIVIDIPILNNLNVALAGIGYKSLNAYRSAREKGDFSFKR